MVWTSVLSYGNDVIVHVLCNDVIVHVLCNDVIVYVLCIVLIFLKRKVKPYLVKNDINHIQLLNVYNKIFIESNEY